MIDTVTVSPKYQVVIPKYIRNAIGISPGEKILMYEKNGIIHMVRIGSIRKFRGRYKGLTSKDLRDENERFG